MIVLFRIDHRLLHGQVAVSWYNHVQADSIFICNDNAAKNELIKSAMKFSKPVNCKLVIKNINDSIDIINSGKLEKYKVLIVVADIKDAYDIISKVNNNSITEINIGGTRDNENKTKIINNIYIHDDEKTLLDDIKNKGIKIFAQQIPNGKKKNII